MFAHGIKSAHIFRRGILAAAVLASVFFAHIPAHAQDDRVRTIESSKSQVLPESTRRVVFDNSIFSGPTRAMPYWDKGYFINRENESFRGDLPNVFVFDGTGQKVREVIIWFPDAERVLLSSTAITSAGTILASGDADLSDGTAAPFIALTDLGGKLTNVIQTKGFYPRNVCGAPDGTVWSFGGTFWDEQLGQRKPGETLRHFDFQKGQVGAYVPQSIFGSMVAPPSALASIRCAEDGVSVYSATASVYIEMAYEAGAEPHVYRLHVPSHLSLKGIAARGRKEVYAVMVDRTSPEDTTVGLYSLVFDEKAMTAAWKAINIVAASTKESGAIIMLWGIDGENLVVGRTGDPLGSVALHWVSTSALLH